MSNIEVAGAQVTNTLLNFLDWMICEGRCVNEAVGRRVGWGASTLTDADTSHITMRQLILEVFSLMRTCANRCETSTLKMVLSKYQCDRACS